MGVRRVALMEDRVTELDGCDEVGIQLGQAPTGDEALVDDRPTRRRRHGEFGHGPAGIPGRRLETTAGDDETALEGVVGDRPRSAAPRDGRATKAWATVGRDAAAAAPSAPGSIGTVRQPAIGRSASAKTRSTRLRAVRPATRPRGRNSMTTAGRSPADCGASASRSDRSRGREMPAPSLDSPSAPNAPRWASAASPASASGRTRARDRPPASATKPTPQASCSKRWS